MDLTIIYTKTSKGSRLRSSLFGGLSLHLKKVLAHVDGKLNAREILTRLDDISESKLSMALTQLELDGYIKQVAMTDWLQVSRFSPMIVEEFNYIEETEAQAEQKSKAWMEDELKAREVVEQIKVKAKAKAAEIERIKVERIAHEAAEARKKSEIEARARAEEKIRLEAKARDDAERIRVKAEVEAKESERISREAEARVVADENARLELELKEKQEADLRLKAELKAREVIEKIRLKEKAKAAEKERLEAKRSARETEESRKKSEKEARVRIEEKTRLEAEHQAKLDAEMRFKAREEAENNRIKAEVEERAKEIERIEAERIAHEVEDNKKIIDAESRAKVEENARFEVHRIAKVKAAAQAKLKAEQKSRKEAERISKKEEKTAISLQKKLQQQAENWERTERKRLIVEEAERRAKVSAYVKSTSGVRTLYIKKWIPVTIKILLVYLPFTVLLLVGLLHFINISVLIQPIEELISESLGEHVEVNEVRASLWPEPHIVLGNVTLGSSSSLKNGRLKIDAISIYPVISTLFENVKVVNSLEIAGVTIEQGRFGLPLQWINRSSKAEHLKIERINFKKIIFKIHDLELTPFEGVVGLSGLHELINIDLNSVDHALSIQIAPQGSGFNFFLTATKWPLLGHPKIVFDELKARGTFNQDQINFNQINGNIYGGSIKAKASVNCSKQWVTAGDFSLLNANTSEMLKAYGSVASIDGKLNLAGSFSGKSALAAKLVNDTDVTASFEIGNGQINGIDLARTVMSRSDKSLTGYATNFDKLTGSVNVKNGHFQYRKLSLQSAQLQAQGSVEIQPNQDISGNIIASIKVSSRRLPARFNLVGKVGNVQQQ